MKLMFLILTLCELVLGGNPDARRLYDDLLANYYNLVRPVINSTDVLSVKMTLRLSQLIDVVSTGQCGLLPSSSA